MSSGEQLALRSSSPKAKFTSKLLRSYRLSRFLRTIIAVCVTFKANLQIFTLALGLIFFFLIGAALPLFAYLISLKWPNSYLRYIKCGVLSSEPEKSLTDASSIPCSFPVIFSGTGAIPPATAVNYVPWTIVGFIFQFVIRRRHFSWWAKYNCTLPFVFSRTILTLLCADVLSAALDSGVAISIILIFFW